MAASRKLVEPRGYAAVTFVSTAMIVAGIGLAWVGLLLAAAGLVLSVIEFKELQRLNPWLMPKGAEDWPMMAKKPVRISSISLVVVVVAGAIALVAVQATDEPLMAFIPAAIAGLATVALNVPMRRALEAGPEPVESPEADDEPDADE